jgi:hypothetical protein
VLFLAFSYATQDIFCMKISLLISRNAKPWFLLVQSGQLVFSLAAIILQGIFVRALYHFSIMPHNLPAYRNQREGASVSSEILALNNSTQSTEPIEETSIPLQNEEWKEHDFEKFIINKFHKDCFQLMQWINDKSGKDIYHLSGSAPDLIYEYRNKSKTVGFAVKCVWRGCYINGSIEWAKDRQLKNYYDYQFREGIDVFIMIGIGNIPSEPAELYIVPLNHIPFHKTALHFDFLQQYKRISVDQMFFLDDESTGF